MAINEGLAKSYRNENFRGQVFAFILTLTTLAVCVYLAMQDKTAVALGLGSLGVAGIVAAFLRRPQSDKSEQEQ